MSTEEAPALFSPDPLRALIGALEGTDIREIEVCYGRASVRVRRDPEQDTAPAEQIAQTSGTSQEVEITAPLTGVYYARPAPEQDVFVIEGAEILPGQVVGLIETMKLFNEVVSEVEGRVVQIVAADGDLVEKGQALIRVTPSEEVA